MDRNINFNITDETDIRSPLKELNAESNKQAEICGNQNKNVNLFDMDSSFANNSVLIPAELDPNQNSKVGETIDSNQENLEPISVLNRYNEEVKSDSIIGNTNVLKSNGENSQNTIRDNENIFVEDFIEKTEEKTATVNSFATELDRSSVSDVSVQSDNSEFNNTVILNKSITVENNTSNTLFSEGNISLNVLSISYQNSSVGEQTFTETEDTSTESLNVSSTLVSSDLSLSTTDDSNITKQQNSLSEDTLSLFDKSLDLSLICKLSELSLADTGDKDKDIVAKQNTTESTIESSDISFTTPDIHDLIEELNAITEEQTVIPDSNDSPIVTSNTLECSPAVDESDKIEIKSIVPAVHEISVEPLKIVNDSIVEQEVIDSNEKPVSLDENINKVPEIDSNKNISCEIKNEINNEQIKESSNSTYEKEIVTDILEKIILLSTKVAEESHMSATEPNSALSEPTVANRLALDSSAACTNEMGEIINQNECFEKQSDITNGAIDNKESLEAKARVYKEMAEKYSIVEAECEKFKDQMADLKKELKSYRQKTIALEAEVADLKQRENELNVLLEEYKQTSASKDDGKDLDLEQLQRLQANEEVLKNEIKELKVLVKQHETHLKELQRKEVKLADDLSCKTQSEMQISRVMEEYEKSISSLISENEKMKKERDTAQMHLANIEMAFSDVHQKYERCKSIVQGYKDNEESFKQDIAMNRETIVIQEQKYETLKAHAMAQLEKSNQELAAMKKQHDTEMTRLTAQLKRYEIKNMSLMESLQQKAKECEQLSAVCDEFIGNV